MSIGCYRITLVSIVCCIITSVASSVLIFAHSYAWYVHELRWNYFVLGILCTWVASILLVRFTGVFVGRCVYVNTGFALRFYIRILHV